MPPPPRPRGESAKLRLSERAGLHLFPNSKTPKKSRCPPKKSPLGPGKPSGLGTLYTSGVGTNETKHGYGPHTRLSSPLSGLPSGA